MWCVADVLILADVFVTFRKLSLSRGKFEVDTFHYLSAPHMAWDAMLKKTGAWLDLISHPAMYLIFASGMRGGVWTVSTRYAKGNNPSVGAEYESNRASSYFIYLDANNLYGWAMSRFLPSGHFSCLAEAEWGHIKWQTTSQTDPFA